MVMGWQYSRVLWSCSSPVEMLSWSVSEAQLLVVRSLLETLETKTTHCRTPKLLNQLRKNTHHLLIKIIYIYNFQLTRSIEASSSLSSDPELESRSLSRLQDNELNRPFLLLSTTTDSIHGVCVKFCKIFPHYYKLLSYSLPSKNQPTCITSKLSWKTYLHNSIKEACVSKITQSLKN